MLPGMTGIFLKISQAYLFVQGQVGKQPPGIGERQHICFNCRMIP